MRMIWGPVTDVRDLGVVAEQCPYCARISPCILRSVCRGHYIFFVKTAAPIVESSCLCTVCLKAFPAEHWRYVTFLSIREAKALALDDLLARTNPALAERRQMQEQIDALGGDTGFALAYQQLDEMRPGAMRARLLKQLLDWDRLPGEQRVVLQGQISEQDRAWYFARQIAPGFPHQPGCFVSVLAALLAGAAVLIWLPPAPNWLGAGLTVVAGFGVAALISRVRMRPRVFHWTRDVLIPEAREANVPLASFLAVVDDVPGSRLGMMEQLWPVKVEIETIRKALAADGRGVSPK
jgi:hypothetical protein